MSSRENTIRNIDWLLVLMYLVLVFTGWLNIYSAVYDEAHQSIFDLSKSYGKQLLWIATSIVLAVIVLFTDSKFFSSFSFIIYLLMLFALAAVLVFGKEIAGSRSWFQVGSFSLQPSEFAKFATNLAVARYLSGLNVDMKKSRSVFKALLILALPAGLIFLQNDTGSALVYSSFIFVFYREGLHGGILVIGLLVVFLFLLTLLVHKIIVIAGIFLLVLLLLLLIKRNLRNILILAGIFVSAALFVLTVDYVFGNILEAHQRTRINVLLGIESDPQGAGYNVNQSLIAIGSGSISGKGFLQGTQTKFDFVPEQSTDFIFCTIGEEWGFIGSSFVVLLFVVFLVRLVIIAERQRSDFSRIYGYGVACIILFHFMVNIAMTLGLFPVIGIPLPFISYGGSSLWAFTILLFIFIRLDADRRNIL